jgi:hypothetical protein
VTATVISLDSRRPAASACQCPAHIIGALEDRLRLTVGSLDEGALLVDGPSACAALMDALTSVGAALDAYGGGSRQHLRESR